MAELVLAVACQRVIVDAETNNVSFIDVIEQLTATKLPTAAPPVCLCSLWARDKQDEQLYIRLIYKAPGGEATELFKNRAKLTQPRYRLNVTVGGYLVTQPGDVEFIFEVEDKDGWHAKGSIVIPVALKEDKHEAQPSGAA